jgi:hypothetical protein
VFAVALQIEILRIGQQATAAQKDGKKGGA